jgi:hypothetical protein
VLTYTDKDNSLDDNIDVASTLKEVREAIERIPGEHDDTNASENEDNSQVREV